MVPAKPARPKPLTVDQDLIFRPASAADAPRIVEVVNRAYERERWLIPGPRTSEAEIRDEIATPEGVLIVAECDQRLVGTVRVKPLEPRASGDRPAEIGLVAVDPGVQGLGIGPRLVAAAETWAREHGHATAELACGRELGMVDYYSALGYEAFSVCYGRQFGSTEPFALVSMRKRLR